jgi:hypothetical protein
VAVADGTDTPAAGGPARRWPGALAVVGAVAVAYVLATLIGRAQEADNVRILGLLDPFFLWIRGGGATATGGGAAATDWLERHVPWVAGAISAALLVVAISAWRAVRRLPRDVLAVVAVLLLGVWGQSLLLMDVVGLGTIVYLAGILGAVALGWWRPMRRLPGFPGFGADPGAGEGGAWHPSWRAECAIIFAIGIVALLFRTWGLTEQSDFLDLETVDSFVQSRTLEGVADYYRYTFLSTNPGAAHMLPQWALFQVFGASIFTLRMAAVLWGVAAVLLMYGLVRRLAGVTPAVVASLLLALAPDQLFWSRSENGFFSPVPALALATVHVGLWMAQRFSFPAVLCAALLMPVSRYFYTTCLAMFLFPLAVAGHATLFVRGAWKRLWFVVPLLAMGLVFWWFHLTLVLGTLKDGDYRFLHPAQIYGGTAWTKQGDFSKASLPELIGLQAQSMADNLSRVIRDMTYEAQGAFGHWYMRAQPNPHPTTMNVALVTLLALGMGYLAGQLRDPRAFALLVWLAIALLPGIMSRDATPRRMSMLFPAAHIIGTLLLAAAVRIIRQAAGRRTAEIATGAGAVFFAVLLLTNTVSFFRMPMQPVIFADYQRFLRPILADSDTWFLNLPRPFISLLQFSEADRFVAQPWCIVGVHRDASWLRLGLQPQCDFADHAYGLTFTPDEIEAARTAHRMQRITYAFFVEPVTQAQVDLIRALYPQAEMHDYVSPRDQRRIATVTIDLADSVALRAPLVRSHATPPPAVLADVGQQATTDGAPPAPGLAVEGGLWLDADSWYAFTLQPACAGAALAIDGQPATADRPRPLLAGVHRFALTVAGPAGCDLPLRLAFTRPDTPAPVPLGGDRFTSPAVAELPAAAAPPVATYPGYRTARQIVQLPGRAADLAIGPDGILHVALLESGSWRIRKYGPDGQALGDFDLGAPRELDPGTMTVADDGTVAILFGRLVFMFDAAGKAIGNWDNVWFVWETQLATWGDQWLATIPHRDSIAELTRDGKVVREFDKFEGGPGQFFAPTSLALSAEGDLAVLQPDGKALRFRTPAGQFAPAFVRQFPVQSASNGVGFDGPDRLLLPTDRIVQVFDADGTRLMAEDPTADLSRLQVGRTARVRAADGRAYILDPEGNRLWLLER